MTSNIASLTSSRFARCARSVLYMLMCFSIFSLAGCEKKELEDTEEEFSETPAPEEEDRELSMYARITHTGNTADFGLDLNVEIAGKNAHNTTISGKNWTVIKENGKGFFLHHWLGKFNNDPIILRPSKKVGYLNVSTSYGVEKYTEEVMHVTIELFVENKLVKTERFHFVGKDGKSYGVSVNATDYID